MTGSRGSTATLAALGVLYWSAHTMLRPLIGPYVLGQGGTASDASIALASFAVLPTVLAIPVGALTDRWGPRALLVAGGAVMAVGGLTLFIPAGLAGVIGSQALIGVGTLAVWVSLQTVATLAQHEAETTAARNARLATFSLFLAAGQAIGPALGGALVEVGGYAMAFAGYTGLSVLVVALALCVRGCRPEAQSRRPRPPVLRAYREGLAMMRTPTVAVTVVVSFTALVVLDIRNAYHPVLLSGAGLAQWQIGLLLSVAAAFGFLSRPFFPLAMARLRPTVMVGLVLGVGSVSVVAVVLAPSDVGVLAVLAAVNGFALGFAQPLTLSLMADHTPEEQRGLASGLRSTANRAAQFANPAIFGLAAGALTLTGSFVLVGGLLAAVAAGSVAALGRAGRRGHGVGGRPIAGVGTGHGDRAHDADGG
ncbi:MFS transporter [uncultured Cellulomonas sp.]|uniref:MFS transporter n=1 Tax=uncultured Cellulomonas sp. TaxID=189682 RepID=UPI0026287D66|nr:MFS transporter [uncultured Cellulomonas sp.]